MAIDQVGNREKEKKSGGNEKHDDFCVLLIFMSEFLCFFVSDLVSLV